MAPTRTKRARLRRVSSEWARGTSWRSNATERVRSQPPGGMAIAWRLPHMFLTDVCRGGASSLAGGAPGSLVGSSFESFPRTPVTDTSEPAPRRCAIRQVSDWRRETLRTSVVGDPDGANWPRPRCSSSCTFRDRPGRLPRHPDPAGMGQQRIGRRGAPDPDRTRRRDHHRRRSRVLDRDRRAHARVDAVRAAHAPQLHPRPGRAGHARHVRRVVPLRDPDPRLAFRTAIARRLRPAPLDHRRASR